MICLGRYLFSAPNIIFGRNGAPGRSRTHDHLVRSQVLYPAELLARCSFNNEVWIIHKKIIFASGFNFFKCIAGRAFEKP